jgi:hypothetical protein
VNDNVSERLARLERENRLLARDSRRIKLVGALMLALLAGVFLLGQGSKPTVQETLTAKEFILVDGGGNTRALLGTDPGGGAGL